MKHTRIQRLAAKPFLKWAGGKRQLLTQIDAFLPSALKNGTIQRYVEPFVGGGALFFHIAQHYPIDELVISDANSELILAYRTLQTAVEDVISALDDIEGKYLALDEKSREAFFYATRTRLNSTRSTINFSEFQPVWVERTAQFIFLNRTCYNGLYRVNGKGAFNVPFGRYKNPRICHAGNLRAVAQVLQRTQIVNGRFPLCAPFIDNNSFVYFDPPYRPLSKTAHFTSYSARPFNDADQLKLATFFRQLDERGATLMLSNSDPHNSDPQDDFFEEAYAGFVIERVRAKRKINSRVNGRGAINELLIMNYTM